MFYTGEIKLKRNPFLKTSPEQFRTGIDNIYTTAEKQTEQFFKAFGIDVKFEGWNKK
ncbi:hypothetical protein [Caulobacter phage Cr30]|uniref:hypothetical protein n=1 Tax=Caulobacter phage Cr30 TaxID=1357714 RepID=UPI0004A9BAF9|nr:hypothetical protein OZ74_gp199 [Caulobacter phage Cr30]AGS81144.1 hypothetical protein [Caulobacter phage Cr30]